MRYAIKLGEITLHSDKPISDELRKAALDTLRERPKEAFTADLGEGMELRLLLPDA